MVEVVAPHKALKGRSDKALLCPLRAWRLLDTYPRCALLMAIILRPLRVPMMTSRQGISGHTLPKRIGFPSALPLTEFRDSIFVGNDSDIVPAPSTIF